MPESLKVRKKASVAEAQRRGRAARDEVGEARRSQIMLSYIDCVKDFKSIYLDQ